MKTIPTKPYDYADGGEFISPKQGLQTAQGNTFLSSLASKILLKKLSGIRRGRLALLDNNRRHVFGEHHPSEPNVTLTVNHPYFYTETVFGGSIGTAEAYMLGYWTTSDLTELVRLFLRNKEILEGMEQGVGLIKRTAAKLYHLFNNNSQRGSRKNIHAHYDLSNAFFKQFLDPTMMYSSAFFRNNTVTLEQASTEKNDRICKKLGLTSSDHLIEIGTGWGGFAIHAASKYGCRITTTTISEEQYREAVTRVKEAGMDEKIRVVMEDYRNLKGTFDALVSIEMIEAVGWQHYNEYFSACSNLLKPAGRMLIQAITIDDRRYEEAKKDVDFIQRYIFPGSNLPSVCVIAETLKNTGDMRLQDLEDITPHYAETLKRWREKFFRNIEQIKQLGFSDEFIRMWEFYFCYCEGGFREHWIRDVQLVFEKPERRHTTAFGK